MTQKQRKLNSFPKYANAGGVNNCHSVSCGALIIIYCFTKKTFHYGTSDYCENWD